MKLAIISLQVLVILMLIFFFSFAPSTDLFYQTPDKHLQKVVVNRNLAISDRNIALWSEREVSRMLNMTPPIEQEVEPAFEQLVNSFVSRDAAGQFFLELNKIKFFDHLISQKQHTIFAPTQETVVLARWKDEVWILQTKGLLTFRSSEEESTIKLILQMNIKIDKRSGKKRFSFARLKRLS